MNQRQTRLLQVLEYAKEYRISEISELLSASGHTSATVSVSTLKRDLNDLIEKRYLIRVGQKRNASYSLSGYGLIHRDFDIGEYMRSNDARSRNGENNTKIFEQYNFELLDIFAEGQIFSDDEKRSLEMATQKFHTNAKDKSLTIQKKELERFIIELSWKSSQIEGNTYSLLDTERLIREGIPSKTNTKDETTMILNHKNAFSYILECNEKNRDIHTEQASLSVATEPLLSLRMLESVHELLIKDLDVSRGFRKSQVGITGTNYKPLSIQSQIIEQVTRLIEVLNLQKDVYSKALIALLCISYMQPFEDGNKRTSRLFSNAILITDNHAPLSYRTVDEKEYREAVLIFYEQNSIEPFKKIFMNQYIFSCENYNIG